VTLGGGGGAAFGGEQAVKPVNNPLSRRAFTVFIEGSSPTCF